MQLTNLFTERRAVSPVVGVILVIAIAVALAGVVGSFALGFEAKVGGTPQVMVEFNFDDGDGSAADALTITHNGGTDVEASRVIIDATQQIQYEDSTGTNTTASDGRVVWSKIHGTDSEVTVSDSVTVYSDGNELDDGKVEVLWVSNSKSAILGEWTD